MFSVSFTQFIIYGSLIMTSLSVITLLVMLLKDYKEGTLW